MSMGSINNAASRAAINVTPLIDVLLVLLIIFMVIQPVTVHGLQALAPRPASAQAAVPDLRDIVVQVSQTPQGRVAYRINGSSVIDLQASLQALVAQRGDPVLFVRGEPGLDYEAVLAVLDSAHAAGVQRIGILTSHLD